jgi:hypothetical protein
MIPFSLLLLLAGALVLLVIGGVADALSGEPPITAAIIILPFPPTHVLDELFGVVLLFPDPELARSPRAQGTR